MANISAIKLPNGTTYNLKDNGALQLTGGSVTGSVSFGDSVSMDDLTTGQLVVEGAASVTNNLQVNTINGVTVGSSPKFTDTVTTVSVTGSGNAITTASASNGTVTLTKGTTFLTSHNSYSITNSGSGNAVTAVSLSGTTFTVTKGTTFLTSHQDISGKADKSATVSTVAYDSTNKKITKTINGTTSDVVTVATLKTALGSMPASDVYSWAKAETKPTYTASEVGALASTTTYVSTVTTTAGTHTAISSKSGAVSFNIPTKTSHLTNDSGFITGITAAMVKTALGTGSGTTKFLREDGTWATPAYIANTDAKLQVAEVTSATQYYPLVGTGTTAATRQYDTTGFKYKGTTGTTSAVGSAILELGNSTASGTAGNKQGQLIVYGTNAKKATITLAAPSADISLALPTSGGTLALTSQIPTVPTKTSQLTNDSGFLTSHQTITSSMVTTALGYTPYNSTNPNGYTTNTGTVTKVTAGTGLSIGTTSGGNFTTTGTINHTNSITAQTTQAVYPIKIDAQGHISAYGSAVTIPTVPSNIVNTITTTAGTHTAISSQKGNVSFNVPTKTSHLTNDSGFITSYTDTKVSTASISSTDTNLYYPVLGTNSTTASTKYINTNLLCYNTSVGQDKTTDLEIGTTGQFGRLVLQDGGGYAVTLYTQQGADALVELPGASGQLALVSDITDENMKWTASTSTSTFYPLVSSSTATTGTANTPSGISFYQYYNTAGGYRRLDLGNSTNYTSSGGAYGMIRLYGTGATYYTDLKSGTPTGNRTITLPNATGTLALTSDIPSVPVVKNGRSSQVTINSSNSTTVTITYSGFTSAPRVVGTLYNVSSSANQLVMYISTAPTTTQTVFTIRNNGTANRTAYIDWIAVGS